MSVYGFSPNQTIYKYELIREIGSSQADVWLAKDVHTNTEVALKVLDASNGDVATRLYEAKVGARLQHPNLCEVKYADVVQIHTASGLVPFVVIAFSYLPHGACTRLLQGPGMMPVETVRHLLLNVLSGLEYLHENGWYHNDIKPANVLCDGHGNFLLTDYGIAWSPSVGSSTARFYKPHVTPETAAASGIHTPNVKSDIYQVGATAYRLLNGGNTLCDQWLALGDHAFYSEVAAGSLPNRSNYHPSIPSSLRRIVNKALESDPAKRFASAIEMRRELEKLYFKSQWTFDSAGEMVCLKNAAEYRLEIECGKAGWSVHCRVTYRSGKSHRISKFSFSGLKSSQVEARKKSIMQAVISD